MFIASLKVDMQNVCFMVLNRCHLIHLQGILRLLSSKRNQQVVSMKRTLISLSHLLHPSLLLISSISSTCNRTYRFQWHIRSVHQASLWRRGVTWDEHNHNAVHLQLQAEVLQQIDRGRGHLQEMVQVERDP